MPRKPLGEKLAATPSKQGIPAWLAMADACLHDAKRNLTPVCWAILEAAERKGFKHDPTKDLQWDKIPKKYLKEPELRRLAELMQRWDNHEVHILSKAKAESVSEKDAVSASENARQLLQIHREISEIFPNLSKSKAKIDPTYLEMFRRTINLTPAALKPLVEMNPRRYPSRWAIRMREFFKEYSQHNFLDRLSRTVQPDFKIVGEPVIKGDQAGLETALNNLVQDAINHNPPAPINVEVRRDRGNVRIKVFNPGPAIPKERLKLIGHDAYWSRGQGRLRGRGKISVRQFCEDHGGTLKVYNVRRGGRHYGPCLEMVLPSAG